MLNETGDSLNKIVIQIVESRESSGHPDRSVDHGAIQQITCLNASCIIVQIRERHIIYLDERNGFLDHAGRIQDDAVAGDGIDDGVIVALQQRLVRKEVHEALEDAAGRRVPRLAQRDDAGRLDSV